MLVTSLLDVVGDQQHAGSRAHYTAAAPLKIEEPAILAGTQVLLSDDAAKLLDDTFKTDAVKGGLLIGISTITINAS